MEARSTKELIENNTLDLNDKMETEKAEEYIAMNPLKDIL